MVKSSLKWLVVCILGLVNTVVYSSVADSILIEELGSKSLQIVYGQPDSARGLIEKALALCAKPENESLAGLTYNYLGIYYDVVGENDSAFEAYHTASEYAIKQNNKQTLAASYNNIGLLHWNLNQLTEASEFFFKASVIYEKLGNEKGRANTYSNIGLVFEDQRRPIEALEYTQKALNIRIAIGDTITIGKSLSNIGLLRAELGDIDSGIYYHKKALPYFQFKNDKYGLGLCYHNLGTDFHLLNQFDSALFYAKKALVLRLEIGNKKYIAATQSLLGNLYKSNEEYVKSISAYKASAAIYEKYNVQGELWKVYDRLSDVYALTNKWDSGFVYLQKRIDISDTLHSNAKVEKLYEVEEKYESEKTKRELAESNASLLQKKQQSQVLLFVLIVVGLITIGAIVFYKSRIRKNKALRERELLLQKLEISRELHDNVGSQLTYLKVKLDKIDNQSKLSDLSEVKQFARSTISDLRSAIWGLSQDITADDLEMRIASEVQKAQNDGVDIVIDFISEYDGHINSIDAVNGLRIVQEALQNAIKHAKATSIKISAKIDKTKLWISVEDNGSGIQGKSNGFGMRFMEQRAQKMGAVLTIKSDPSGTNVTLDK